jgi:hypothetical protein
MDIQKIIKRDIEVPKPIQLKADHLNRYLGSRRSISPKTYILIVMPLLKWCREVLPHTLWADPIKDRVYTEEDIFSEELRWIKIDNFQAIKYPEILKHLFGELVAATVLVYEQHI